MHVLHAKTLPKLFHCAKYWHCRICMENMIGKRALEMTQDSLHKDVQIEDTEKEASEVIKNDVTSSWTSSKGQFGMKASNNCLHRFPNKLIGLFYQLGHLIALHPSYFIIIPIFLTALGLTGVQQITYEKDPEYLFSPTSGKGQQERNLVENLFPVNSSAHFDSSTITRLSNFGVVIASAKDGGSMLRVDPFNELVNLDEAIRNLTIEWQDDTYSYFDVCAKMNGHCIENSVLDLKDYVHQLEEGRFQLDYPINIFPLVLPFFLGGTAVNESTGKVLGTKAILLTYFLRGDDWKQKEKSHIFEGNALELLNKVNYKHIHVDRLFSRSLADELDKNGQSTKSYILVTAFLMTIFSVGSVLLTDWVRSKLYIGLCGLISLTMATIFAFGFLMYCQVPFSAINFAAPFLMLGIGLDDMFVLLSAWHETKIQEDVPVRLGKAYRKAAISITITSLTNMLSFFIGTITPFPAVRIFCIYTGFSILFTYIWFLTLFGGCLALAGYQEKKQWHSITLQNVLSKSESENIGFWYKLWCAGGINRLDPWNPKDNQLHPANVFFRDRLGKALNTPKVKALVIGLFVLYMSGAIYGCTRVQEGLEKKNINLDSSYLSNFFDKEETLFRKYPSYRIQVIINDHFMYSDPETERALLELHDTFENLTIIADPIFTQSWVRGFYKLLEREPELKANITDEQSFIICLKTNYFREYSSEYLDVKFNDNETKILASRFILSAYDIKDTNEDKAMMLQLRKTAMESRFNIEVFNPYFVFFDQFIMVKYTCIQAIALAVFIMIVVSVVLIPNSLCSLWIGISIISIEVGVIGYMSLWNVNLDGIAMINLIMAVGFSVDFSAHISYSYTTAEATSPAGRVEECLYSLGFPIVQGGLSTIIGVLALSLAPSYVFTTFFKIVLLAIVFGLMHGLLLLPVMLSLLGPGCRNPNEEKESQTTQPFLKKIQTLTPEKGNQCVP